MKNNNKEWIWLDMDGTFVDFYGVEGWLEYLQNQDATPYKIARPKYKELDLLEILVQLKISGYRIGVCSWLSKTSTPAFDKQVTEAKREWMFERCLDVIFDEVIIAKYGSKKSDLCRPFGKGILVDDEAQNRDAWDLGTTIDATKNIIEELKKMVDKTKF